MSQRPRWPLFKVLIILFTIEQCAKVQKAQLRSGQDSSTAMCFKVKIIIYLFLQKKIVPIKTEENVTKNEKTSMIRMINEEELKNRIEELSLAKAKYGKWENMPNIELRDGSTMPVIAVGTALVCFVSFFRFTHGKRL